MTLHDFETLTARVSLAVPPLPRGAKGIARQPAVPAEKPALALQAD